MCQEGYPLSPSSTLQTRISGAKPIVALSISTTQYAQHLAGLYINPG